MRKANQKDCADLTVILKNVGMTSGELDIDMSKREADSFEFVKFNLYQISAAHNRACGYCLGEHLANLAETPLNDSEAARLAEMNNSLFVFH